MSKELEEARGVSVSLRWASLNEEDLETQLSDLNSLIVALLRNDVGVWLAVDDVLSLELRGERGVQQVGLLLAQYGFVDFPKVPQANRVAICLGGARPVRSGERVYQLPDIFREGISG